MYRMTTYKKQNGAALVVGLILLVVITVLAISGMNTATTELAMARNDQNTENAFQAAETGIEAALAQGRFDTLATTTVTQTITSYESVSATIEFEDSTLVPDRAFSLGVGSGINAYHFIARPRRSRSVTQAIRPTTTRTQFTPRHSTSSARNRRRCKGYGVVL